MKPTEKSPEITAFLNSLTGGDREADITADRCVSCKQSAAAFRDEVSRKEFSISGFCQECQDKVFGE